MLNSGKKKCATKKINIPSLVMSEKNFWTEKKPIAPLQVKWSVPYVKHHSSICDPNIRLVRKDMDVNEHERLCNITLRYKFK
jgi:hypothetical protein